MKSPIAGRRPRFSLAKPIKLTKVGVTLLATIVLGVAAVLLAGRNLALNGLGNLYYTAAITSGAHNLGGLFFSTFDRFGTMAVDKPPLAFVLPSLAVRFFGLSTWTVLGPQVVVFAVAVVALYRGALILFGQRAAFVSALCFLLTPIEVAVASSDNPDAMLVFVTIVGLLVGLAAIRRGSLRWAAGAGLCVGLAFTTKQIQSLLGVPALVGAFVCLSDGALRRRLLRASVFVVVATVSSGAWLVAVDAVSPSHRPYVAGSVNNSEVDLAFGLNGARRVRQAGSHPAVQEAATANPSQYPSPGLGRLVNDTNWPQSGWLLPGSLLVGLSAVVGASTRRRPLVATLLAWTGSHALFLSFVPGKVSPYYVAPLVPGVALLLGVGLDELLRSERKRAEQLASFGALFGSVSFAAISSDSTVFRWLAVAVPSLLTLAFVAIVLLDRRPTPRSRATSGGLAVAVVVGLLLAPARWSFAATEQRQNSVAPAVEVVAGGETALRDRLINAQTSRILNFVRVHTKPDEIELATNRVMAAASEIVMHDRQVAQLGGFSGWDPYPKVSTLERWVRNGDIRYVALPAPPPERANAPAISPWISAQTWAPWVRQNCRAVPRHRYHGISLHRFWAAYDVEPLRAPLVLFDCRYAPVTNVSAAVGSADVRAKP